MSWRAMDSAWWAALGAPARWGPTWTGYASARYYTGTGRTGFWSWMRMGLSLGTSTKFFQSPFTTGGNGAEQMEDNNYDTGFFWVVGPSAAYLPQMCAIPGMPNSAGASAGKMSQCQPIIPHNEEAQLRPVSESDPMFSAYYKTGFLLDIGNNGSLPLPDTVTWFRHVPKATSVTVWHYQPWAWNGTPPEVIAAILMQCGLDDGLIESANFTNAHDDYHDTTGVAPWLISAPASTGGASQIYCSRRIGQTVADLLVEICRHTRDMLMVNEAGNVDIVSFTSPQETYAGLGLDDGVVAVQWEITNAYLFNSVLATWGAAHRCYGEEADPPDNSGFSCSEESNIESMQMAGIVTQASNSTSVSKYGEVFVRGKKVGQGVGPGSTKELSHYGLFLEPGVTNTQFAGGYGGLKHLTYWLASDSKPRKLVTVAQDMRALDWGLGAKVTSVAVTDDGQTISDCRCIERTYDFDRLTVESVLMEVPANT